MTHRVTPEVMTPRARAYLIIVTARHVGVGLACILVPQNFYSRSFQPIKHALPLSPNDALMTWGLMFLGTGALAAFAAWRGQEGFARWALLASAVTSAIWAAGFIAGAVQGETGGPIGWMLWLALTLKDVTMLRAPLRNPFEPMIRKALNDAAKT